MQFRKPPVVEVWISVEFEPNENKRDFDRNRLDALVEQLRTEFPKRQVIGERTIEVQETTASELPRVVNQEVRLQGVRLWDQTGSRAVLIGDDRLEVHLLRTPDTTPGFRRVREATEPRLAEYVQTFQPVGIRSAALHYLDIVDIPVPDSGELNLQDYFTYVVDLPKSPFGTTTHVAQEFQLNCPVDAGPLFLRLQSMPESQDSEVARFRVEWHKQSLGINSLEPSVVWERLEKAHDYMRDCFKALLSERTLELFEPIPETDEN